MKDGDRLIENLKMKGRRAERLRQDFIDSLHACQLRDEQEYLDRTTELDRNAWDWLDYLKCNRN